MLICKQIQYTQDTIQIQYNTQYAQSVFYSMKDWMWKMKLTFESPRKERVLWRRTVADSKEGEGSPVQRNAKGRQEVKWSPVQRNAKGRWEVEWSPIRRKAKGRRECKGSPVQRNVKGRQEVKWSPIQRNAKGRWEVEWSPIQRKAKGRRFDGMRRVAVELNRRRLALNGASSAAVWASSVTAKLNRDGEVIWLFVCLFYFILFYFILFFMTKIWLWREFQLFRYSALLKKKNSKSFWCMCWVLKLGFEVFSDEFQFCH